MVRLELRRNWFASDKYTYQHGTLRRIHRNAMRIGHHSNCRSRSSRPSSQIVCPLETHGICCTGSKPHANASPCRINPAESWKEKKNWKSAMPFNAMITIEKYLRIDSDDLVAFVACICEYIFVAFNAIRMLVTQYISLTGQTFVTLPAAEMTRVPVLVHCLRVFTAEN